MRIGLVQGLGAFAAAVALVCSGCGKTDGDANATTAAVPTVADSAAVQPTPAPQVPPEVVLNTNLGSITLRLNAEMSPRTVKNFLTYVKSHFYDGTLFHQVYKNQGIIGGAYDQTLTAKKPTGVPILNEARNGLKNTKYTIAMLREPDDCDSATCTFFINAVDNPSFDFTESSPEGFGYCVFGEVIQGADVVDKIATVEVQDVENVPCTPVQKVVITSAKQTK